MFDLIIKNGLIYDGKGSEPFKADLAISNEKIVEIGKIEDKGCLLYTSPSPRD